MVYLLVVLYFASAVCWLVSSLVKTPPLAGALADVGEPTRGSLQKRLQDSPYGIALEH